MRNPKVNIATFISGRKLSTSRALTTPAPTQYTVLRFHIPTQFIQFLWALTTELKNFVKRFAHASKFIFIVFSSFFSASQTL
jgi:hypothetical protein